MFQAKFQATDKKEFIVAFQVNKSETWTSQVNELQSATNLELTKILETMIDPLPIQNPQAE